MLAPSRKAIFGRPGVLPVSPGPEAESGALVLAGPPAVAPLLSRPLSRMKHARIPGLAAAGLATRATFHDRGRDREDVRLQKGKGGDLRPAACARLQKGWRETSGRGLVRDSRKGGGRPPVGGDGGVGRPAPSTWPPRLGPLRERASQDLPLPVRQIAAIIFACCGDGFVGVGPRQTDESIKEAALQRHPSPGTCVPPRRAAERSRLGFDHLSPAGRSAPARPRHAPAGPSRPLSRWKKLWSSSACQIGGRCYTHHVFVFHTMPAAEQDVSGPSFTERCHE